ncbi:MAG: hypothetical protein JWO03_3973, partial [Bacteroidetes bacterium]|nr:hypothetical protein [Bacteroidota bacterium]
TSTYCLQVTVAGGKPPFRYAISSTGSNSGFGAYQSSNIFCICTGHYWVRVLDSCSNIFTTAQIDVNIPAPQISLTASTSGTLDSIFTTLTAGGAAPYTYHLSSGGQSVTNSTGIFAVPKSCKPDTITVTDRCGTRTQEVINPHPLILNGISNCATGDALISIGHDALGPFTITGSGGTQTTHGYNVSVNGLPLNQTYTFNVTDSCGNIETLVLPCTNVDTLFFEDVCPFDSSLHFKHNQINYCYPVILTCLNCVPVQKDTLYSTPIRVFSNIDTGVSYTIRIQDSCGFDYTTRYTTYWGSLAVRDSIFTCSDFVMMSDPRIFVPPVHYNVFNSSNVLIDSATANRPVFYHVPAGAYQVIASHDLCRNGRVFVNLPFFGGRCAVPMMDSSCTPSYAIFQPYMPSVETFTLVNAVGGATYSEKLPRPTGSPLLFANVPVGTYNLVSDSGCSIPYVLPPYHFDVTATYRVECTGQSQITATVTPAITSCNTSQGQYFTLIKDNQYYGGNTSGSFIVSDTGYFVVRVFLSNTTIFNFPATFDTICPLDTFLIFVRVNPIPNLISVQQEVCGHNTANIPYTILGGTAPYTVQIIGYPTRTVPTNTDTFPGVYPGVYTMVVSDNCGISRSYSVAVVDTCSSTCITQSEFSVIDSVVCRNTRVSLHNLSAAATHYKWTINGVTYGYTNDTSFVTNVPGTYVVTLYAYLAQCVDSSTHRIVVEDTLRTSGVMDTFICAPFGLKLNTHYSHSIWSTGVTDSVITVSATGLYWAQITNSCGSGIDSFNVSSKQSPLFDLAASQPSMCEGEPDSTLLTAALADSSGSRVTFSWSTGYVDSLVYSSQIIIYQADTYHVMVADSFCPVTKNVIVAKADCDSLCFVHIAIPDAFSPNGDGRNDTFHLLHFCKFDPFSMRIYNRWGELVFESTDIDKGWDGKYKGEPQADGVYWWYVSMSIQGRKPTRKSGKVTLLH